MASWKWSNVGLAGNDSADKLVKAAASRGQVECSSYLKAQSNFFPMDIVVLLDMVLIWGAIWRNFTCIKDPLTKHMHKQKYGN